MSSVPVTVAAVLVSQANNSSPSHGPHKEVAFADMWPIGLFLIGYLIVCLFIKTTNQPKRRRKRG